MRKTRLWRLMALTMALLLASAPAQAVFSPQGADMLRRWQEGEPLALTLGTDLAAWSELPDDDIPAVAEWLSKLSLRLHAASGAAHNWDMSLAHDDQDVLRVSSEQRGDDLTLTVSPPATAYMGTVEREPLSLLLGDDAPTSDWASLPGLADRLQGALPALWEALAPYGEHSQKRQTIRNVGTAVSRIEYTLSAEQWNTLWPQLSPALTLALRDESPAGDFIRSLRFTGEGSLRRLLDRDGRDIALRFAGRMMAGDTTERHITLLVGRAPGKGLYLNLKAPQTDGSNTLEIALTAALADKPGLRTLSADWAMTRRQDGPRHTQQGALTLRSRDENQGEAWSGRLRVTDRPPGGKASRYTLTPTLTIAQGQAQGTLHVKQETGGKTALDVTLTLDAAPAPLPPIPTPQRSLNLRDTANTQASATQQTLSMNLLTALRGLLMKLPEPQRLLLIHLMGRDLRTQDIHAPEIPDASNHYLVTTEEETP